MTRPSLAHAIRTAPRVIDVAAIAAAHAALPRTVAALFVDPRGPYPSLVSDWYDAARDARSYHGDGPVVAHPPCQLWGNLARVNFARYGGEHNRPGNDGGTFAFALATVRRCGGVLEHPAGSYAWPKHGLTAPSGTGWLRTSATDWVCEVWQSAYGHKARKRTWLFYSSPLGVEPFDLDWTLVRALGALSKREASATPERFARELIALASHSRPTTTPARVKALAREQARLDCLCEECDGKGQRGINEDGDGYPCPDCDASGLCEPGRAHVLLEHGVYTCGLCGFDLCGDEDSCPSCMVRFVADLAELLRISVAEAANGEAA